MERMTIAILRLRLEALNNRMHFRSSMYRYDIQRGTGWYCLERMRYHGVSVRHVHVNTVYCGTKNEIATYINAMCTAIDDVNYKMGR